jgi:hypothetical protein
MALSEPLSLKFAATDVAFPTLTLQLLVPEQAPDQPAKVELAAGAAERVTLIPDAKFAVQDCPQLMPAGLLVITPVPGPVTETDKEALEGAEKAAPTVMSPLTTTVHLPVPEHAPDQPENESLEAGAAVRVTEVPALNDALQLCPQLIPAGALVTVPEPVAETARLN